MLSLFFFFFFFNDTATTEIYTLSLHDALPIFESNSDTVRIANDSLEYEIIIIEPGFKSWLVTQPKESFYSQEYLEIKNRSFVVEYNYRVQNPNRYPNSLYPERIDYNPNIDYGKEVNYLLYNYFIYFQEKYHQHFIGSRN